MGNSFENQGGPNDGWEPSLTKRWLHIGHRAVKQVCSAEFWFEDPVLQVPSSPEARLISEYRIEILDTKGDLTDARLAQVLQLFDSGSEK